MGFAGGIVSEVSFTPRTVRVINPLVLPKLGAGVDVLPGPVPGWCNISPGQPLGGLVLSCEEWEADSRRLSRLLLQASVFEWKIIHLEDSALARRGGQRCDWEISYTLKCSRGRCNLSGRGEAGHAGSLLSVSICHSHPLAASLELLSPGKLHTSVPQKQVTGVSPQLAPVTKPRDVMTSCRRCLVSSFPQGWP